MESMNWSFIALATTMVSLLGSVWLPLEMEMEEVEEKEEKVLC